ncbi:MAG: Holliday junction branch migration protein RuvA [Eubacteriales bacterium]|nr:Holliday junction branch migration protein RuvA [Eubacteriales bacterium]MDD4324074.1 Holliday junction branch migration protein RuvA [Eubacteriales bacterium]MDD4541534.1 Holliday junction branch migration protein RuvA [Eubacteriales bacterium]
MIARVNGKVLQRKNDSVVVNLNGLGLRIESAPRIIAQMPPAGEEVALYTHLHVRENELTLFGFKLEEEMHLFSLLITVSGIGPKIALQILEALDPSTFALAVLQGDISSLTQAKGIGKKGAERIILELKDKVAKSEFAAEAESLVRPDQLAGDTAVKDAVNALVVLGYSAKEAEAAIKSIATTEEDDVESLLRKALRNLSKW